ncbi:MAG: tRNA (adenosine(37)-N6)-threonylcarbamoyltransferase complex dimerization subunit type 1 TsaB [Bacteroidales bacterium]|nr:tRNA (adenosine(37)-N6)-threonylcarbamoyltransferase complex dimerization subunit type 1 TsaB [Bacteroidales bacterium]
MILCLETATPSCSVALVHNGEVLACEEDPKGQNHSEKITLFIDSVMKKAGVSYSQLDAVAVSMGPGSYTGLRIGVSTAKGICYAVSKPLIAVETLEAMAYGGKVVISTERSERRPELAKASTDRWKNLLLIPAIDARRMEVYAAIFDENVNKIKDTEAIIIDENSFADLKKDHHLYLFGDGADKCADLFANDDKITVIKDFYCSAKYMNTIAQQKLNNKDFVDVAYFEPFYLKDFVPGTPTVKGLH